MITLLFPFAANAQKGRRICRKLTCLKNKHCSNLCRKRYYNNRNRCRYLSRKMSTCSAGIKRAAKRCYQGYRTRLARCPRTSCKYVLNQCLRKRGTACLRYCKRRNRCYVKCYRKIRSNCYSLYGHCKRRRQLCRKAAHRGYLQCRSKAIRAYNYCKRRVQRMIRGCLPKARDTYNRCIRRCSGSHVCCYSPGYRNYSCSVCR